MAYFVSFQKMRGAGLTVFKQPLGFVDGGMGQDINCGVESIFLAGANHPLYGLALMHLAARMRIGEHRPQ